MSRKGLPRYILWIAIFALLTIALTMLIIVTNRADDNVRFVTEVLGIGFCMNMIASLIVIIFFEHRYTQHRTAAEASSARRIALEIKRYLAVHPLPDVTALRDKLEYLHDTLSFGLHDEVKKDIEKFLHDTRDDAIGTRPDKTALKEIDDIAAALKNRYGDDIFATVKKAK